jgi:hypothetical protein
MPAFDLSSVPLLDILTGHLGATWITLLSLSCSPGGPAHDVRTTRLNGLTGIYHRALFRESAASGYHYTSGIPLCVGCLFSFPKQRRLLFDFLISAQSASQNLNRDKIDSNLIQPSLFMSIDDAGLLRCPKRSKFRIWYFDIT